jgi:hypothetical protein
MNPLLTNLDYILSSVGGICLALSTTLNLILNGKKQIITENPLTSFFNLNKCSVAKKGISQDR